MSEQLLGLACCLGVGAFLLALGKALFGRKTSAAGVQLSGAALPGARRITARYRDYCRRCKRAVAPGEQIDWNPDDRSVVHADCVASARTFHDEVIKAALERIEAAKGPVARRNALQAALGKLTDQVERTRLVLEASRLEAAAVLDKADSLKSPAAKRRHLEAAIATLQADEVPDELQAEQLGWLQDALKALDE